MQLTNNAMLNGGQTIVDYLIQEKVPYAFGLCGHGNIGFIDALFERSEEIKTISSRHETVSGFMADPRMDDGTRITVYFRNIDEIRCPDLHRRSLCKNT
jgi:hypothetical protein